MCTPGWPELNPSMDCSACGIRSMDFSGSCKGWCVVCSHPIGSIYHLYTRHISYCLLRGQKKSQAHLLPITRTKIIQWYYSLNQWWWTGHYVNDYFSTTCYQNQNNPTDMWIDPEMVRGDGIWDVLSNQDLLGNLGESVKIMGTLPSLKLTYPLKIGRAPKRNDRIPTIHFQGLC